MSAPKGTVEAVGHYACGQYFEFFPAKPVLKSLVEYFQEAKCPSCGEDLRSVSTEASEYVWNGTRVVREKPYQHPGFTDIRCERCTGMLVVGSSRCLNCGLEHTQDTSRLVYKYANDLPGRTPEQEAKAAAYLAETFPTLKVKS